METCSASLLQKAKNGNCQGRFLQSLIIRPIAVVAEVCSHSVQLHGLCALCGSDVSQDEKTTINMTHDARGITLSVKVIFE